MEQEEKLREGHQSCRNLLLAQQERMLVVVDVVYPKKAL